MKSRVLAVFCLVLVVALGGQVFAQTQMTVTGSIYMSDTPKFMPIDKDHALIMADNQMGIFVADSGKGPFNNLSSHTVWIDYHDTAKDHWLGLTTFTDKDGDTMIFEIRDGGAPNMGTGKIIGATGKFTGMEGTANWTLQDLKSWPEGTRRTISFHNVWKLTLKKPLE
jgi:hypothetical protein